MSTAEKAYNESQNRDIRDELILNNIDLVREVLGRVCATLPSHVDRDNLEGAGMVGLLQAADKYTPSRGEFRPFAKFRIRGAMFDELRKQAGISQEMLRRIKDVEAAQFSCNAPATLDDIARRTELTLDQVADALDAARWLRVEEGVPLDALVGSEQAAAWRGGAAADDPAQRIQQAELHEALTAAILNLADEERQILAMYFNENLTLAEIGSVLDVHPGNVSRKLETARHKLLQRLRIFLE